MKVNILKSLTGLHPANERAINAFKKLEIGGQYEIDIPVKNTRSGLWHRRYWALCSLIYQNCDDFKSSEEVHIWLKLECGLTKDMVLRSTGEIVKVADSIAFDKMDNERWAAFWRKACDVVHTHILPGIDIAALEDEIAQVVS